MAVKVLVVGDADNLAPLSVCILIVGTKVNFPTLDTTERVFRKVSALWWWRIEL